MDTPHAGDFGQDKIQAAPLRGLWKWIIRTPLAPAGNEQRSRLLAGISAVESAAMVIVTLATLLTSGLSANTAISFVGLLTLLGVFMMNRRGAYENAAAQLIGVLAAMPVAFVLTAPANPALLAWSAMIATSSIAMVVIFFPGWKIRWIIALLILVSYLVLPFLNRGYAFGDVLYVLGGVIILWGTGLVVEHQRNILLAEQEKSWQTERLAFQQAKSKADQQLKDIMIELDATVDEFVRANEEIKQAKDEAERANTVKSAFLASMSHELRTPLNAVINFTKFVAKGSMGPVNQEQADTLYEVIDSAKHLLSLINDVLDMSKIESGSLNLFVEDNIDLKAVLDSAFSTGKILLADKPVTLDVHVTGDLPSIRGDRQRILQILLNIISNACKFTEQGYIKVEAAQKDAEVLFTIEDSGPGIAPEDQDAVFEAFKQTTTGLRQGGGTGLGMPISKNLAEAHGGRMWLTSEVGKGTTFYVALPVKSDRLTPTAIR